MKNQRKKAIIILAVALFAKLNMASTYSPHAEAEPAEVVPAEEQCINRFDENWKPDLRVVRDDGTLNRVLLRSEAECIAKVLYGTARYNTPEQQETAVWCVINRMESKWYPDSIEDVCKQQSQFKGFSIGNPVEEDLLMLATKVLVKYYVDGYKPCDSIYTYMSATDNDIVLRTSFVEEDGTHYWKVG